MSASGPSKTSSSSSTTNENTQIAASQGGIVAGANSSINIENADADVLKALGLADAEALKSFSGNVADTASANADLLKSISANQTKSEANGFDLAQALGTGAFDLAKNTIESQASEQTAREQFQATIWEQSLASQAGQLAAITDLGKTTATGGQSDFNQTLLYLGVAGVLGVAAIFIFGKR